MASSCHESVFPARGPYQRSDYVSAMIALLAIAAAVFRPLLALHRLG
jgi:hypothetical protein